MIRTLILLIFIYIGWSSPGLRYSMASFLRNSATWIEPREEIKNNPEHFKIPNPFYKENKTSPQTKSNRN